jgi:hypothetical protein
VIFSEDRSGPPREERAETGTYFDPAGSLGRIKLISSPDVGERPAFFFE